MEEQPHVAKAPRGPREPKARSKKYKEAKAKIDKSKLYSLEEAVKLVKSTSYSKFDGTVELHLTVKKEGLSVQVSLPHSTGKTKKIEIANEGTIKKLEAGKIDFDVLLATPDMMPKLVPFAKLLGPRGLMPNPKNGSLIKKLEDAKNFSADTVVVKTEKKAPLIHTVVGKVSQKENELTQNTNSLLEAINRRQIIKAYMKPTMGPSVKLAVN
ncbi:hypothetical protein A2630_02745 [Candidatus Woesebacteria bacterium RIFCSPHIGHO2_01_FULL_44_10]|uniref:Large ribosomal subunit protein uL1 n=1 Tax=Candidatus Woesebacteria bacterium RIFCSPLOWO2_01_FULL_44_14 TaxID=1802525 RepID=A0A1F8C3X3_9BACT|nr:MAG: hypothetical protein A2630_02745 [Candidatus Woesebacteria bacterium RIFCSPHIGHO2_01_FULL_44_10]OGM56164.1 MAG: hypothetical protein A3F62_00815 [Candidatus Woesebacteria bacterium RIFCSPHIGHO2_12_FULL_44_11]OGM70974.1 MAG: hypothetical protein A2975_01660 [Candidatus Woesebacteria bacterium RIFCSPLOWO2_01_FULL_44_14]